VTRFGIGRDKGEGTNCRLTGSAHTPTFQ
jgi:hypothetical protein